MCNVNGLFQESVYFIEGLRQFDSTNGRYNMVCIARIHETNFLNGLVDWRLQIGVQLVNVFLTFRCVGVSKFGMAVSIGVQCALSGGVAVGGGQLVL